MKSKMSFTKNYNFYTVVSNFNTDVDILEFEDFIIIKLKQGKEAADWRNKLRCKIVPRFILQREFRNYQIKDDDVSGFDNIMYYIQKLLFVFRLYKSGDILFLDNLIEDMETNEKSTNVYVQNAQSDMKYTFNHNEIKNFENFKNKIFNSNIFNINFLQIFINYFMSGVSKGINFNLPFKLERIIDYFIALESVILIDDSNYFLSHRMSERISKILSTNRSFNESEVKKLVKFMYNIRSVIVHGNFVDLNEENKNKKLNDIKINATIFEDVIRETFKSIISHNFSNKIELEKFLKKTYEIPKESEKIIIKAIGEARSYFLCN